MRRPNPKKTMQPKPRNETQKNDATKTTKRNPKPKTQNPKPKTQNHDTTRHDTTRRREKPPKKSKKRYLETF